MYHTWYCIISGQVYQWSCYICPRFIWFFFSKHSKFICTWQKNNSKLQIFGSLALEMSFCRTAWWICWYLEGVYKYPNYQLWKKVKFEIWNDGWNYDNNCPINTDDSLILQLLRLECWVFEFKHLNLIAWTPQFSEMELHKFKCLRLDWCREISVEWTKSGPGSGNIFDDIFLVGPKQNVIGSVRGGGHKI